LAKDAIRFMEDGSVEALLPKAFYMALVKVQAERDLGWVEACAKAAELIDSGSTKFKKNVKEEARRLHNSELMRQMNAARETIKEKAWEEGAAYARRNQSNFKVPCPRCGKPMRFSDSDANWDKVNQILTEAFGSWAHPKC
jgi:hypothetical protein